jgi:hypothetical protein
VARGTSRGTDIEVLFPRGQVDFVIRIEVEHQMRDIQYPTAAGWVRRHATPYTAATIVISTAAERTAEWFADSKKTNEMCSREFSSGATPEETRAIEDFAMRRNVYYIPVDYYQELVVPLVLGLVLAGTSQSAPPSIPQP